MLCSSLYIPVGNLQQKMCIFTDELILSVQYMYLSRGHLMGGESPILDVISPPTRVGWIMLEIYLLFYSPIPIILPHYSRATAYYSRIIAELEFTIGRK